MISNTFQNLKLCCSSCSKEVFFELIKDIECDWGIHDVIRCPNCEELFSIDKQCVAFGNLLNLLEDNTELLSEAEKSLYITNPHQQ